MLSHHPALLCAYAAALAVWWLVARPLAGLWPGPQAPAPARPWRELGLALVAVIGVLGMGQLYQHGVRLPSRGGLGVLTESINQACIFAPMRCWRRCACWPCAAAATCCGSGRCTLRWT